MKKEKRKSKSISIETNVSAPIDKVWKLWTTPDDIIRWNYASDDWHTPRASNDLKPGGKFLIRMESKDGKAGFDFGGIYKDIKPNELISYTIGDGREVKVIFKGNGQKTKVIETFEAETENPVDFQRKGWQSILDNFKKYAEVNK